MAPGAVLATTTTHSGGSEYSVTREYVVDQAPSTVIRLGPSAEIFVAQAPVEGGADHRSIFFVKLQPRSPGCSPSWRREGRVPPYSRAEATSPFALRNLIDSLEESRRLERETFQFALDATRETMATLATQSGILRDELIESKEQARLEKAVMQDEYFGRLDELTAKLSTSATRTYNRELTIRELALEARRARSREARRRSRRGQATACRSSDTSSWRLTAPPPTLPRLTGSGCCERSFAPTKTEDPMRPAGQQSTLHRNISVIVLNYNQADTTVDCLEALHRASSELIL